MLISQRERHQSFVCNQAHCLQSREFYGDGLTEGFAHFYAANIFNDTSQTDCKFVYYKEFREPDPDAVYRDLLPPIARSCDVPQKWMHTLGGDGRGRIAALARQRHERFRAQTAPLASSRGAAVSSTNGDLVEGRRPSSDMKPYRTLPTTPSREPVFEPVPLTVHWRLAPCRCWSRRSPLRSSPRS